MKQVLNNDEISTRIIEDVALTMNKVLFCKQKRNYIE